MAKYIYHGELSLIFYLEDLAEGLNGTSLLQWISAVMYQQCVCMNLSERGTKIQTSYKLQSLNTVGLNCIMTKHIKTLILIKL